MRREGIELTTGFIATVNADLGVGAIEETITVTGAAPVVDVQGMLQQQVFSRETVRTLPIGKNAGIYAALIPGAAPLNPTQQDVGGTKGEDTQWFRMHNSGRSTQLRDGMFMGLPMGGANFNSAVNPATIDEVAVQLTGTLTAEAQGDGPQTNFVPRDGGNVFSGSFATDFGHRQAAGRQHQRRTARAGRRASRRPAAAVRRRRRRRRADRAGIASGSSPARATTSRRATRRATTTTRRPARSSTNRI